jgi:hypothetical protein
VNEIKKRLLQNTPKACTGGPAERPSGMAVWAVEGWAGRQAKAGEVGKPAGPSGQNSEE